MPYRTEWVDPELFVRHQGVAVYHTYKDDDWDCGTRTYWFTLSFDCGDDRCFCPGRCRNVFDVHELPTWKEPKHPPFLDGKNNTAKNRKAWQKYQTDRVEEKHIKKAIRKAVDRGILKPPAIS